jgi:hypothetical protein
VALIRGIILVGGDWLKSRTRGVVIAERVSRYIPRYAPEPPAGPPLQQSAVTAAEEQGIDLAWQNGTGAPAVTEIWVSTDNASFTLLVSLPLSTTTYKHMTGVFGVRHYYKLRHSNRTDDSVFVTVDAVSQVDYPNAPPTTLTVTPPGRPTGETRLDLAWANGDSSAQTEILRRTSGGAFSLIQTVAAGVSSYQDTGRAANTAYDYFVRHTKSGVPSAPTSTVTGTTLVDGPDADPTILIAARGTGVSGQGKINLSWTNGDSSSPTFIYVSTTSGGALSFVSSVGAGVAAFTHDVGAFDVTRFYKVVHVKNGVFSNYTSEASAASGYDIPDADPSGLQVAVPARPTGETQLNVSWANGDATAQTRVYRDDVLVQTVAAGGTTWTDTGRTANTTYAYRVAHVKSAIESNRTAAVTGTTLVDGPDAAPSGLGAGNPGAGNVDLTWTNGDASASTEIYRSISGGAYSLVTTQAPGVTSFTDSPGGNVNVSYRVRHIKNSVTSSDSNTVTLTTLPPPSTPSNVVLIGGDGRFDLSWTNGAPGDPIKIYKSINDAAMVFVTNLAAGTTSYFETGYAEDTKGVFFVSHAKNGFESAAISSGPAYTYDKPNAAASNLASTPRFLEAALSWTIGDSSGSTELWYRVVGATNWSIASLAGGQASFTPSLVAGTNYQWFVRHIKVDRGGRTWSIDSSTATFTTRANPSGLSLTAAAVPTGETVLNGAWTNGDGTADVLLTLVRTSDSVVISSLTLAPGTTSRQYTGLTPNTNYTLFVQHRIAGPYFSNSVTAAGSTLADGPDAAPSALSVSSNAGNRTVSWTNGDTTAQTQIFRDGVLFTTVAVGVTSLLAEINLEPGDTRAFKVRHVKNSVVSGFSNEQSHTIPPRPNTPTVAVLSRTASSVTIQITGARTQDFVMPSVKGPNGTEDFFVPGGGATGATSYQYTLDHSYGYSSYPKDFKLIFAVYATADGWSVTGNTVTTYTTNPPGCNLASIAPCPSAGCIGETYVDPQILTQAGCDFHGTIVEVERQSDFVIVASQSGTARITGLVQGTNYKLRGRHYKDGTDGVRYFSAAWTYSNVFTTLDGPDAAPSGLSVSDNSSCQGVSPCCQPDWSTATLFWTNGDASASTEIYRSTNGGQNYSYVTTVAAGDTSWSDDTPVGQGAGTTLYYEVRHIKSGLVSAFSNVTHFTRADVCDGQGCSQFAC